MERYAVVKIIDEKTPQLGEFLLRYESHALANKKASSVCVEKSVLRQFVAFVGDPQICLADISGEMIDRWKARDIKFGYASNSIRLRLAVVRGVFKYAQDLGILWRSPFANVKMPKHEPAGRLLSDDEIAKFLGALPPRIRNLCVFALYTGMRRNEVINLTWEEVRQGPDRVELSATRAKNGRKRTIYLHPNAVACLGERKSSGNVFGVPGSTLNYRVTQAWRNLGIGRIRFHDLRHVFATRYLAATHDLPSLMAVGGWSSADAAMTYQHPGQRAAQGVLKLDYPTIR